MNERRPKFHRGMVHLVANYIAKRNYWTPLSQSWAISTNWTKSRRDNPPAPRRRPSQGNSVSSFRDTFVIASICAEWRLSIPWRWRAIRISRVAALRDFTISKNYRMIPNPGFELPSMRRNVIWNVGILCVARDWKIPDLSESGFSGSRAQPSPYPSIRSSKSRRRSYRAPHSRFCEFWG